MATIGQNLQSPESGWRRYDDTDSRIRYIGTGWTKLSNGDGTTFNGGANHILLIQAIDYHLDFMGQNKEL